MSEQELIERFESLSLEPGTFPHAEHVRLAYAYLSRLEFLDALGRYRTGLRRFAAHAGAPGKYHETITCALVVLIHERMAAADAPLDWEGFIDRNPDLLEWRSGPFFDYYEEDILVCERARTTFVLPNGRGLQDGSTARRKKATSQAQLRSSRVQEAG